MPMEMERIAMRRRHFSKRLACDGGRRKSNNISTIQNCLLFRNRKRLLQTAGGWWSW